MAKNKKYTSALTQEELEQIAEYMKERSDQMIEDGVDDIKSALKDALIEKLYSLGHEREDAIRTVTLITDGGQGVDFKKKLNIPEDSKVAAKFYDIYEKYEDVTEVYKKLEGVRATFERMDELKNHMKPNGTYDREGKLLLEDTLYKFLGQVKNIADKIPGGKYYHELIDTILLVLPKTISNCKDLSLTTLVDGWVVKFSDDNAARLGTDGKLHDELSDASLQNAILNLSAIDWKNVDEESWLSGPSVMQLEYLMDGYPDEVDEIGVYVKWRFAYELEEARKNWELSVDNMVTRYINEKKTKAAELLYKYDKNAPTEADPPVKDEDDNNKKEDISQ